MHPRRTPRNNNTPRQETGDSTSANQRSPGGSRLATITDALSYIDAIRGQCPADVSNQFFNIMRDFKNGS